MKDKRLQDPHILPLERLVQKWRRELREMDVPHFDPDDGGTRAKLLFLFEKPGPMATSKRGSGFISQDNNDPTARAVKSFLAEASIHRSQVVIWNAIPAWDGERRIRAEARRKAPQYLLELLAELPSVRVIVAVGREASKLLQKLDSGFTSVYTVVPSLHPSPINRASRYAAWSAIPHVWHGAAKLAGVTKDS